MADGYEVIVVGARCAGSPTGMLLARRGYRVLVVDRATFPSDTNSTLLIHPPGGGDAGPLARAGEGHCHRLPADRQVLLRLSARSPSPARPGRPTGPRVPTPRAGCFSMPFSSRAPGRPGAEVREGLTVEDLMWEDGTAVGIRGHGRDRATVIERARVVVGADGINSRVVKAVAPAR